MTWKKLFNSNRIIALFLMIAAGIIGWYSLILMTDPIKGSITPDKYQWIGLGFTLLIGIFIWIKKCLTIKPH
tara:strand:+ start:289 stop:504 length:216 start_codon:yes stop_codon:yes gene_type:complete